MEYPPPPPPQRSTKHTPGSHPIQALAAVGLHWGMDKSWPGIVVRDTEATWVWIADATMGTPASLHAQGRGTFLHFVKGHSKAVQHVQIPQRHHNTPSVSKPPQNGMAHGLDIERVRRERVQEDGVPVPERNEGNTPKPTHYGSGCCGCGQHLKTMAP